ncbi:MAG: hypothetical protein QF497_00800, partial [Verrucomicrobiota bacterium]|nr:hypothetical protein [Verrucomicrobiota bacterium]
GYTAKLKECVSDPRSLRWSHQRRLRTCQIAGTEGDELRFRRSRDTPPLLIISDFHDQHPCST